MDWLLSLYDYWDRRSKVAVTESNVVMQSGERKSASQGGKQHIQFDDQPVSDAEQHGVDKNVYPFW